MGILVPARLLAWAASGVALGAGMKLGSYLVAAAMGDKEIKWDEITDRVGQVPDKVAEFVKQMRSEPLWKRQFTGVSQDEQ